MLGWFKRTFSSTSERQPATAAATAPAPAPLASAPAAPEPEPAPAQESQPSAATAAESGGTSLLSRLRERLGKTRDSLVQRLDTLVLGRKVIDQDLFDELEEILITADLGAATSRELLEATRRQVKRDDIQDPQALKEILRQLMLGYFDEGQTAAQLALPASGPFILMVVGVNGVGKTTTIGKIGHKFVQAGHKVLLAAGDTFRAAAIDQLKIWGERIGAEVVAQRHGADPSSVVYDAIERGLAQGADVIIVDTAGRLHTKVNLMEELKKIHRVIGKKLPGAPHEVLLVLDATTGQNGLSQARLFNEAVGINGLALTKLDGTAKGGIIVNIRRELKIPIRFIGIGEQMDDLRDFDPREFVEALFQEQER